MKGLITRSRRPIVVVVAALAVLMVIVPPASAVKRPTARLQLSPAKHAFASLAVGKTSASFTFTVTNNGTATSAPVSFSVGGTNSADFVAASGGTNGCVSGSTTLAIGASCTIAGTFRPISVGKKAATLTAFAGSGEGAPSASLTGSGTAGARLTISPTDHDFGQVPTGDTSSTATFTVTNTGATTSGPIHDAIVGTDNTEFTIPYQTNLCDLQTLAPAATCTIGVYFGPTSSGAKSAELHAWANDYEGTPSATLEGEGQDAPPACTVTANSGCIVLTSVVLRLLTSAPGANPPTYGTKTYTLSGTMSFTPTCLSGPDCDYSYPNWVVTGNGSFQVDDGSTNLDVGTWTTQLYPVTFAPFVDSNGQASTCHDAAIRQMFTRFQFTGSGGGTWLADYVEIRTDTTATGPYKNMVLISGVEGDGSYHTSDVSGVAITC